MRKDRLPPVLQQTSGVFVFSGFFVDALLRIDPNLAQPQLLGLGIFCLFSAKVATLTLDPISQSAYYG